MMDRQTHIAVNTSHIDSSLSVGNLYMHRHTESLLVILIGLEHSARDGYKVEFIRLHDWRTFYATYTALEWRTHWTHLTH